MAGKGQAMLVIDYFGKRFGVGLLTDMPSPHAVELVKGSPWTGFGHLCQAQVDRIRQDYGQ
jgi:hypothetical protein